uniref:Phenoloxidase-activating factor 2 n=1 Tax=Ceratitis capitata TaxID=7213 RepID=W8B205_CERCA
MSAQLTIYVLCLLTVLSQASAQGTPNFEKLLDIIFAGNTTVNVKPNTPPISPIGTSPPIGKTCGFGKECVPRKLCNDDGTVNRFGTFMLNLRIDGPCAYLETCCDVSEKLPEPKPVNVTSSGCGYRNFNGVSFKISGAQNSEAEFAEFPWMVAIYTVDGAKTIYKCGGSIIAPNVVLTAAHCVWDAQPGLLVARAGEWDLETTQEPLLHQDAHVSEIIRHEKFNSNTIFNDIAILILTTPYTWSPNVQPICLPDEGVSFDGYRCYAAGWGKDKFGKEGAYQHILKKIDLPVVPHAKCQENLRATRLSRYFQLDKSFMCAGGEADKDTCKGDGGSPLMCPDLNNPGRYLQAGVVSWGIECGVENIPGVYADVPSLRKWIDEKLTAKGIDTKYYTT